MSPCVMTNISVKENKASYVFDEQTLPLEKYVFGNVMDQPLQVIWNSKKARKFRAGFEKRLALEDPDRKDLAAPCLHCYKLYEE